MKNRNTREQQTTGAIRLAACVTALGMTFAVALEQAHAAERPDETAFLLFELFIVAVR